jgi:hypothetical protein
MLKSSKCVLHSKSLLDEPFTEWNLATERRVPRSPAFLLDPIICEALKAKGFYPPMPNIKEFAAKGLNLDSERLKAAIRRLLIRADAPLFKEGLHTGVGNVACFSPALHNYLLANLEPPLRKMVRDFLLNGELLERDRLCARDRASHDSPSNQVTNALNADLSAVGPAATGTTRITSSGLDGNDSDRDSLVENERPRKKLNELHMRKSSDSGRGDQSSVGDELAAVKAQRDNAYRRLWRMEKQKQAPFRIPMPDGSLATPVPVDNLIFDRSVEREPGQKGKRLPTFTCDAAVLVLHGSKETRPDGHGWRWTLRSKCNEFLNWMRGGIEAAHRSAWLREMNLNDRMITMYVVPTARNGHKKRHRLQTSAQARNRPQEYDGYRLLDNPSPGTTYNQIIPAFLNLFGLWVVEVLQDPCTVRVGVSTDGCKAKSCGLLGTYFSIYQRRALFTDPLGNMQKQTKCLRFPGPMTQTSNKLVKTLKDSRGGAFPPEAAYAMAKALYVGNLARWFLQNVHLIDLCLDGGPENKGCGPAQETANRLCGENSIFDQLVAGRGIWPGVIQAAEEWGLKGPMDEFFGNAGFRWEDEWSADKLAPAMTTLNTDGPVFKAREVVEMLSLYQKEESENLLQQLQCVRPFAIRWLTRTRCRLERAKVVSDGQAAKFRTVKLDKDLEAHRSVFLSRLSARHAQAFKSRILQLRCKRFAQRSDSSETPSNRACVPARPISMKRNPLRFLPCRRRTDGKRLGLVNHCGCHRIHNLSERYVKSLNAGLLEQVVSMAKWLRCDYYWPDIFAAIQLLLGPIEDINEADMQFFTAVRSQINVQRLASQCKYDVVAKGVRKPLATAVTRWATTTAFASYAFRHHQLLAFAILKWWAHGQLDVRIRAAVKVLSAEGFDSKDFQQLRLEPCAKTVFAFLTNTSDILQMAILHVLNAVIVKPLLAAMSANYECGTPLTMGLESKKRAILLVLRRDIWVRCFAGRGWRGSGWNRTLAAGCRTDGAEFCPDPSVRLLRPKCKAQVKARLGDWQLPESSSSSEMKDLLDEAAGAVDEFMEAAKMLAGRKGPMLPEDMQKAWSEMWAKSHSRMRAKQDFDEGMESYAGRLSQAQYALHCVCKDSAEAIIEGCQRELFALYGFIANMGKTRKTEEEFTFSEQDGAHFKSRVLLPDTFAVPNAVSAFIMARDLREHYREQGIEPDVLAEHLPTWGNVVRDEYLKELIEYGGFNIEPGQALEAEYTSREEWDDRRCHRPAIGVRAVRGDGSVDLDAYRKFERTISCFDKLYQCSEGAGHVQGTSKGMESTFSPITVIGKSKGPAKHRLLDAIARRGAFKTTGIDPMRVLQDEESYWNAEKLAQLRAFDGWVRTRDKIKGMRMDEANKQATLPAYARSGGLFPVTNHGISSRSKKYCESGAQKQRQKRACHALEESDLARRKRARTMLGARKRARTILGATSRNFEQGPSRAPRAAVRKARLGSTRAAAAQLSHCGRAALAKKPPGQGPAPGRRIRDKVCDHDVSPAGDGDHDLQLELDVEPQSDRIVSGHPPSFTPSPCSVETAHNIGQTSVSDSELDIPLSRWSRGTGCPSKPFSTQRQSGTAQKRKAESADSGSDDDELDRPIRQLQKGARLQAVSKKTSAKESHGKPASGTAGANGSKGGRDRGLGRGGGGYASGRGDRGRDGRESGGRGGRCGTGNGGSASGGCRGDGRGWSRGKGRERKTCPLMPADPGIDMANADDDDEIPIFAKKAPLITLGTEIRPATQLSGFDDPGSDTLLAAQGESGAALRFGSKAASRNVTALTVWSKKFCFEYYGSNPSRFQLSGATYVPASNGKPVTYEVKRNLSDVQGGSIRFPVRMSEHRMFYIVCTEETGPILISVIEVARNQDDDWSQTIRGYRVYTAEEAILRADRIEDILDEKGLVTALGRASLTRIAADDEVNRRTTYHCGDRLFWMDVRNVVGVVRWSPVSHRGQRFTSLTAMHMPGTSIVYVGTSVSEPPPPNPRT